MSIYVDLTRAFNEGCVRAILSSGQAVVLHRLAIMSKDGDWILRESEAAMTHVLGVLAARDARYRFGAPLDVRWLAGGWSSHFEFQTDDLRVRTDFVTRPPRIPSDDLDALWREMDGVSLPYLDVRRLVEIKKTNREKDYAVIGELARRLEDPRQQILASRSARDLIALAERHPTLVAELAPARNVLTSLKDGRAAVEVALDAERRALMHANERRLHAYLEAAEPWSRVWMQLAKDIAHLPLVEAHGVVVERALGVLPFHVPRADA